MSGYPWTSVAFLFAATAILLPALSMGGLRLLGRRLRHGTRYLILMLCVIRILIPTGLGGPTLLQFSDLEDWVHGDTVTEPPITNVDPAPDTSGSGESTPPNGDAPTPDRDPIHYPTEPTLLQAVSDFFVRHSAAILFSAWGIGALAFACALLIPQWRLQRRELRFAVPVPDETLDIYLEVCRSRGIKHAPTLVCLDLAVAPHLCAGQLPRLRSTVRLGNTPFSQDELWQVLGHELVHARRHDLGAKRLLTAALIVFWWNPLVWMLVKEAQEEQELSCDEAVLDRATEEERIVYGNAILKALRHSRRSRSPLASALSASGSATVTRFREITSQSPRRRGKALVLVFCLLFLISGAILGCSTAPKPADDTDLANRNVTDTFFLKDACNLSERQLLEISKTLEIPSQEGMHMVGWNVYSDATENGNYSLRLEAALKPNAYHIRLLANGGSVEDADAVRLFGDTLPHATRSGYTFGGWFRDAALTRPADSVPAGDCTLYAAWAEESPTNDFLFTERNGSITILSYRGAASDVTIPAYVGGKPVTSIAVNCFAFASELTTVTLPATLTQIGAGAFRYCFALQEVTLMGEVRYLDQSVFEACYAFTALRCPASVREHLAAQLPTSVQILSDTDS